MTKKLRKLLVGIPKFWKLMVFGIILIGLCQYLGAQTVSNQISNNINLPAPSTTTNSNSFISTWNTSITYSGSSNNTEIKLPLVSGGQYNFNVSWGDNSSDVITSFNQAAVTHNYNSSGVYEVNITGNLTGWAFKNGGDCQKLIGISQWGNITLGNSGYYFEGCQNLVLNATDALNLNGTTDLSYAFAYCNQLGVNGSMNTWNVSNVTNMADMFKSAQKFNQAIDNWNVANVTNMSSMFANTNAFNQAIGSWDVSSVTNMSSMFSNAIAFNQAIGSWDVSSVTEMSSMFSNAIAFNQAIDNWNVLNVINMSSMFNGASIFNQNLYLWNVLKVTDMSNMFAHASAFNQPIGGYNVLNNIIGGWNISNVINMSGMFKGASTFNQNFYSWNVSKVTDMSYMFYNNSVFNQPIGNWNVSNVRDMSHMFNGATAFNQNIGGWNVSNVRDMSHMFEGASVFNQIIGGWNVSNVRDMSHMFEGASVFNQNIGGWNVSNINDMSNMFTNDTAFFTDNYGDLLLGWSQLSLQHNVTFSAGSAQYPVNAETARQSIITTYNWTITDGGLAIPPAPVLSAIASPSTTGNVTLKWSTSTLAKSYSVYRSNSTITTLTGATLIASNVINGTYQDENLTYGTYYYVIVATNGVNDSQISNCESVLVIFKPSEPTNLSATAKITYISLKWEAPIYIGGSAILYYNIYRSDTVNGSFALIGNSTATSYNDSSILGGNYYYKITAVNAVGEGNYSSVVNITLFLKPSEPIDLNANVQGNIISVTWKAPVNNGGSTILYYEIYRTNSSNGNFTLIENSTTSSYNDSNVTAGQTYYYKISAVNIVGTGNFSNIVNVAAIFLTSQPTNLNATTGKNYISLTWTTPVNNGGSTNIYYKIYRTNSSNGQFTLIGTSVTTTYYDLNIINGQIYYYKISAVNPAGESNFSNIANVNAIFKPSGPTNLNAKAGTNYISLTWEAPINNGGSAILYYEIYRTDSANGKYLLIGNSTTTSYNDTKVTSGQTYYYEVLAVNKAGKSSFSNIADAIYTNTPTNNKSINGMGIGEILSVSVVGALVVVITMKKRLK